jgi:hypothetical protein
MDDLAMAVAVREVFLSPDRNLRIASSREIVSNTVVDLLCCQANRQKVPASAVDIRL